MAVAFNEAQDSGDVSGFITSVSTDTAVDIAGSDVALVAHIMCSNGGTAGDTPSGVTFDTGTPQNLSEQIESIGGAVTVALWGLLAPTGGTADTLTATWSGSQTRVWILGSSWTGVTSFGNTQSGSGTSAEPSETVTGVGNDDMIADIVGVNATTTFTIGANQTSLGESTTFYSYSIVEAACSYQDGADGGVMSWTTNNSSQWSHAALALIGAVPVTLTQTTHRVYDDGTESGSTALEAQGDNLTIARETTFHIREGIQATGDPASKTFKYQYKYTSDADSEWEDLA